MNEDVARRLEKAERAIQAAGIQLEAGLPDFAVSAGYYALFYLAEALLLERDLFFSSHGAVHGAFGREFAKTGEVDPKHHRHLLDAFQKRNEVDRGVRARRRPSPGSPNPRESSGSGESWHKSSSHGVRNSVSTFGRTSRLR